MDEVKYASWINGTVSRDLLKLNFVSTSIDSSTLHYLKSDFPFKSNQRSWYKTPLTRESKCIFETLNLYFRIMEPKELCFLKLHLKKNTLTHYKYLFDIVIISTKLKLYTKILKQMNEWSRRVKSGNGYKGWDYVPNGSGNGYKGWDYVPNGSGNGLLNYFMGLKYFTKSLTNSVMDIMG